MVYDILRYSHCILFVALQTILMFGFFLEWKRDRKLLKQNMQDLKVSVIIPIHNESLRMKSLLKSLLLQTYPSQIIIIDDCSTDNSPQMLNEFSLEASQKGLKVKIITLTHNPGSNRKQYAISRGIEEAEGDYFLFTDGDCEVPQGWIEAMTKRIQDGKTGAVIGPVFKKKQGKGFFYLYQCYDHAIRYNYLAGAIGLGAAGGGFGNNLIVSRAALEEAGGYDAVPVSPTEDAALISMIRSIGKYSVRAIAHPDAAVFTEAEKTWKSFINQTLRWNNGGLFSPEPVTRFNYNFLMLLISTSFLALPFLPFIPGLWPLPLGVYIVMIENSIASFVLFRNKLPQGGFSIFGYFLSYLFIPLHFTLVTIMGYAGIKPKWKG